VQVDGRHPESSGLSHPSGSQRPCSWRYVVLGLLAVALFAARVLDKHYFAHGWIPLEFVNASGQTLRDVTLHPIREATTLAPGKRWKVRFYANASVTIGVSFDCPDGRKTFDKIGWWDTDEPGTVFTVNPAYEIVDQYGRKPGGNIPGE
jgi:hypothetical protein